MTATPTTRLATGQANTLHLSCVTVAPETIVTGVAAPARVVKESL